MICAPSAMAVCSNSQQVAQCMNRLGFMKAHDMLPQAGLEGPSADHLGEAGGRACRTPSNRSRWPPEKPRQLARTNSGRPSRSNSSIACAVFSALSGNHTCPACPIASQTLLRTGHDLALAAPLANEYQPTDCSMADASHSCRGFLYDIDAHKSPLGQANTCGTAHLLLSY